MHEAAADDFPVSFFPPGRDIVYNHLGDGFKVVYPFTMRKCIRWSRKCFSKLPSGMLIPKPCYFTEVVHVRLDKIRCI